ncbi:hypothetical protein ACQYRI_01350 [Salmonella enterica]
MRLDTDIWFALSPRMHRVCWLAATLCSLVLLWWLAIEPLNARQIQLLSQQAERQAALQAQWRKLRALIPPTTPAQAEVRRPFTPLEFQAQERQLVRWQPARRGGEMVLETSWAPAVDLFLQLAEHNMLVPAFSLMADGDTLTLTLRLEHNDVG